MDRVEQYRLIVRRLIEKYASYKPSHGQIETEAIIDREKDH
jgi:XisI protein